jgi:hypothetical protein
MRNVVLNYLLAHKRELSPFIVTDHLPWKDNGAPLYHHNKKHIYVDTAQSAQTPAYDALNQAGGVDEISTVSVYFVNDAKKLPTNYDDAIEIIKGARTTTGTEGFIQRTVQVSSEYNEDAIITTCVFSFRKLITN